MADSINSVSYYKYSNPVKYTTFSMIMAVDNRGAIGLNNDLPWKGFIDNKPDMEWFKEKTKGKVVVMGYNTWVSIGRKPLPNRVNIIITAQHTEEVKVEAKQHKDGFMANKLNLGKMIPKTFVCASPAEAIKHIEDGVGVYHDGGEVMVIGGAKIYEAFMPNTSRIYLSTFNGEFEADTFVHLDLSDFDLMYRDKLTHSELNFEIWDVTVETTKRPDAEIMQIEHTHRAAEGIAAEIMKERVEKENGKNV